MWNAATIKSSFASKYIKLNDDWLEQCVEWVNSEFPNVSQDEAINIIYQEWLILDIRDAPTPAILPPNISEVIETTLHETIYLQLLYVVDISKPKYLQLKSIRSKFDDHTEDEESYGMLKLQLTDGKQEVSAMEYKKIPGLSLNLPPGLKICFKPPICIRRGQIIMEPQMVELRGGVIPEIEVTNCVENILAAALKQPLNNNPKDGYINNNYIQPVPDSQGTSVTATNVTGMTAETSRNVTQLNDNKFQNDFDDIITDDFFNDHLDALETNVEEKNAYFPDDDEMDVMFEAQKEEILSLSSDTPVITSPETSVTTPIKRPIMTIAKLNEIKSKVTKGMFKIKMEIMQILEKLKVRDNCYSMKVLAADDSGEIEVQMGNKVMTDLLEVQPEEFQELFSPGNAVDEVKLGSVSIE